MKTTVKFLLMSAAFGMATAVVYGVEDIDRCKEIVDSVTEQVEADKSEVLNIVQKAVEKNEACAGDIVSAAIQTSGANAQTTGAIVQTAGNAAPGQMSNIIAAAVGANPNATGAINAAAATVQGGGTAPGGAPGGAPNALDGPGGSEAGQATGAADGGSSQSQAGSATGGSQGNAAGISPTPPVTNPNP
jgi:hypothetical protein